MMVQFNEAAGADNHRLYQTRWHDLIAALAKR